jgi:hypothetical protein
MASSGGRIDSQPGIDRACVCRHLGRQQTVAVIITIELHDRARAVHAHDVLGSIRFVEENVRAGQDDLERNTCQHDRGHVEAVLLAGHRERREHEQQRKQSSHGFRDSRNRPAGRFFSLVLPPDDTAVPSTIRFRRGVEAAEYVTPRRWRPESGGRPALADGTIGSHCGAAAAARVLTVVPIARNLPQPLLLPAAQ